jgi:hypothetical protein
VLELQLSDYTRGWDMGTFATASAPVPVDPRGSTPITLTLAMGPDTVTAVVAGVTVPIDRRAATPYPVPLFTQMTTVTVFGIDTGGGGTTALVVDDLAIDGVP